MSSEGSSPPLPHKAAAGQGRLFVVSAPSGAGKTTLCKALLERCPDMKYSISYTTRERRGDETGGIDYHFIDQQEFIRRQKDGYWAEWAEVHGYYYGTSKDSLDRARDAGKDLLLDIDVQGARQILELYPDAVTIFIMAPSMDVLKERLLKRETDDAEAIEGRLKNAAEEIAQKDIYRHVIVNDDLSTAVKELIGIVQTYQ